MQISILQFQTPAKVNIRLKITSRRPDGFHELTSIMVPVDLTDYLEIRPLDENRIEIFSEGYNVPKDESNLVYRAVRSYYDKVGIDKGISIKLTKKIPVAAGLGGGSSDAAAILLMLNRMNSKPIANRELHQLAAQIGADVPFFLYCKPSIASGIGDVIKPLKDWPKFWYIIVTPPINVSTAWVYKNYRLELTRNKDISILNILEQDSFAISRILENDLEQVTSAHFPIIETIKRMLMDTGAEGAIMSGSGPSVFGLFSSERKARSAKDYLLPYQLGELFLAKSWE
ncbi:MAG: 4-(cytidine 5'-diphospho)-2-C-methyl-D-erythritol kinase [Deltaproteobacteria bacterium]|nr:4-(cytidine 5'-diphospho)-2-C-methyl-D-erythritol kinase [Deltaproteobacteria bacterium]